MAGLSAIIILLLINFSFPFIAISQEIPTVTMDATLRNGNGRNHSNGASFPVRIVNIEPGEQRVPPHQIVPLSIPENANLDFKLELSWRRFVDVAIAQSDFTNITHLAIYIGNGSIFNKHFNLWLLLVGFRPMKQLYQNETHFLFC